MSFKRWSILMVMMIGTWFSTELLSQSVEQLKKELSETNESRRKASLNYEIAEALYVSDYNEAGRYARKAYDIYLDISNVAMAGQSAMLLGRIYEKQRNMRNAEIWFQSAFDLGKKAGDGDLIIKSVERRSRLQVKDRDYRDAYRTMHEAFEYLSQDGRSLGDLERNYERQKSQLERERQALQREKDLLESQISRLSNEREQVVSERDELSKRQEELLTEKEKVEQEIDAKESQLDSISRVKSKVEQVAKAQEMKVKKLSREKLEQEAVISAQRAASAEAKLELERKDNQQQVLLIAAGAGAALAALLLILFINVRRNQRSLKDKNRIIQDEQERSDELLLNILPAPIAEELKLNGKAKARRYEQVTVLFSDFKNFTSIAESLRPEQLVEELDTCFKAFDFIISQYEDIEKIKTIGDAYMCVSGLSNKRQIPKSIVQAALEMQAFLDDHNHENQRKGIPRFEARIGLHTGPVVAGVVGVRKFAYDIWGDAVNIASRVETNGKVGAVSVSDATYKLIRYHFECRYQGRIDAKNKGLMDIYHVTGEKSTVSA